MTKPIGHFRVTVCERAGPYRPAAGVLHPRVAEDRIHVERATGTAPARPEAFPIFRWMTNSPSTLVGTAQEGREHQGDKGSKRRTASRDRKCTRCCPVLGTEGLERRVVGMVAVAL